MNFLFHMLLSGEDDQLLVGNFMGDFVKGRLEDRFPENIRRGVMLHRRIDSFAAQDEHFRQSRLRLSPRLGLYRGVLIDLFYDHFLANEWNDWSPELFGDYLIRTRGIVERNRSDLPDSIQRLVPVIFDELLPSYRNVSGIASALERMSRRVARQNPLAGSESELKLHYESLRADFRLFMPGLRHYAQEQIIEGVPYRPATL